MKLRIKFTSLFIVLLLLSSCAFNKGYLNPEPLKKGTEKTTMYLNNDTVNIYYVGDNYQPLIIRNTNDTVSFDYTRESVVFQSESGNQLNGWWIRPKNQEPKITLLNFHGNSSNITKTHWSMTRLVKYGIQVFTIDYSGYGFSTGKATRENVLKDGLSALEYVLNSGEIGTTKFLLYGQSLGGHLAGVVGPMEEEKIDGVIIEGGFSSHRDIGRKFAGRLADGLVKELYSAKDSLKNYQKPLLIIHSTEDNVVPFEEGLINYESATSPSKQFYEIDGCHICGPFLYEEEIARRIYEMVGLNFDEVKQKP